MRRGGPAAQVMLVLGIIAAEHLDKRAQQSVADEVNGEDLAIELFVTVQPRERGV